MVDYGRSVEVSPKRTMNLFPLGVCLRAVSNVGASTDQEEIAFKSKELTPNLSNARARGEVVGHCRLGCEVVASKTRL